MLPPVSHPVVPVVPGLPAARCPPPAVTGTSLPLREVDGARAWSRVGDWKLAMTSQSTPLIAECCLPTCRASSAALPFGPVCTARGSRRRGTGYTTGRSMLARTIQCQVGARIAQTALSGQTELRPLAFRILPSVSTASLAFRSHDIHLIVPSWSEHAADYNRLATCYPACGLWTL